MADRYHRRRYQLTDLEKATYADGFLLVLLNCAIDPRRDVFAVSVEVFDGGQSVSRNSAEQSYFADREEAVSESASILAGALEAGAILAVAGKGWREISEPVTLDLECDVRILELFPTAKALSGLSGNVAEMALAEALGIPRIKEPEQGLSTFPEDLLWAVIAAAGKRDLDWDGLLRFRDDSRPTVALDTYAFGEIALSLLPELPAVYIMKDSEGAPLYVGKAANLKRRLNDYFRATSDISPKLQTIRDSITSFEYHRVGSELEALLLEHRLIGELAPTINTQRTIRSAGKRYGRQPFPIMIILPSASPERAEVLLVGTGINCIQLHALPARPPVRRLQTLIASLSGSGHRQISRKDVVQWGEDGCEIAWRYWGRHRHTLQWSEVRPQRAGDGAYDQLRALLKTSAESPPPGEFRV